MIFFNDKPKSVTYQVKSGDTLYSVAKKYNVSVDALRQANGMKNGAILSIGKTLIIPSDEISMMSEISDADIERKKHLNIKENKPHKVQRGENISSIAKKYGVQTVTIQKLNGLDENSVLKINQELKIPPTRTPKNIKSLKDTASAMGVSADFMLGVKRIEDGHKLKDNEFHYESYTDLKGSNGTKTVGIGHKVLKGEKETLSNKQEVLNLFVKDMLKMEEHLRAILPNKYDKLPVPIKEALLDMVFNKGTEILSPDLIQDIKNNRFESAICKMTNNKSVKTGKEYSGLSLRRLFDMSTASKIYNGKIPKTVINKAQEVYNHGVQLLKKEHPDDYKNILVGYNKDVQTLWGDKIKLVQA